MAKQKPQRGRKSAEIRQLLGQDPKMPVKEIVSALAARGIQVNPNLVYLIKSKMNSQQRRQRAVATGQRAGVTNPAELVRKVKELAAEAGGLSSLKQLVDALAE